MLLSSSYGRKTDNSWLRKQPFQSLFHRSDQGWIIATAVCGVCQVSNWAVLNLYRIQQQRLWHWQRWENTSSLFWKTSTGFLLKDCIDYKILSLVYDCFSGTALQYLQELIPPYKPPLSLWSSSQSHSRIPSVDGNHKTKSSLASGLSPFLPPDSWMPSLRL